MGSKSVAELEAQRDRLDARIKAAKARESAAARKARNHAMIVMGAMVADAAADGDWTRIDMQRLLTWMHAHASELSTAVAVIEPADEISAGKRLREWERAVREQSKARQMEKPEVSSTPTESTLFSVEEEGFR